MIPVIFFSCSDDDGDDPEPPGKKYLSSIVTSFEDLSASLNFSYNSNNYITDIQFDGGLQSRFFYDDQNRLTKVEYQKLPTEPVRSFVYSYQGREVEEVHIKDPGNLDSNDTIIYTLNDLNLITGSRKRKAGQNENIVHYTYNTDNRLMRKDIEYVNDPSRKGQCTYSYDDKTHPLYFLPNGNIYLCVNKLLDEALPVTGISSFINNCLSQKEINVYTDNVIIPFEEYVSTYIYDDDGLPVSLQCGITLEDKSPFITEWTFKYEVR